MSGGGAVAVVVQAQGAPVPGCLFLCSDEPVLVGIDDLLVGFDGFDRAAGEAAQLVGAEPGRLLHELFLDDLALLIAHAVGQLTGGADDHDCVFWGDQPGVESLGGGVVPGVELSRERDLPGSVGTGDRGGLREPGVGTGEPGVLGDLA